MAEKKSEKFRLRSVLDIACGPFLGLEIDLRLVSSFLCVSPRGSSQFLSCEAENLLVFPWRGNGPPKALKDN